MQDRSLCARLKRYSRKCISERLDPDFADAVKEAIEVIHFMNGTITTDKIKDHALYTDEFGLLTEKKPVVHGKWIPKWCEDDEIIGGGFWINECSNCHEEMYYGNPHYCPDCGAKMREENE